MRCAECLVEATGFKLALISKGLRLPPGFPFELFGFQACPDFKGIKTGLRVLLPFRVAFQACPDFKGIKTHLSLLKPPLLVSSLP